MLIQCKLCGACIGGGSGGGGGRHYPQLFYNIDCLIIYRMVGTISISTLFEFVIEMGTFFVGYL